MSNRYIPLSVLISLLLPILSCGELNEYFYNSTSGEPKYLFQDLLELMMSFGPGGDELGLNACVPAPSTAHFSASNFFMGACIGTTEQDGGNIDTCAWLSPGPPWDFTLWCDFGVWTIDFGGVEATCTSATGPNGAYECDGELCPDTTVTVTGAVCPVDCSDCAGSCFLEGTKIITQAIQPPGYQAIQDNLTSGIQVSLTSVNNSS